MLALCGSDCKNDTLTTYIADASYSVAGSVLETKKVVLFWYLRSC